MSRNLVELTRRHHAVQAPTALEVLKEALQSNGEITDEDRKRAALVSGLPEAAVYGVSTFYDDLLQPRGERHLRVCTGTACFAATADAHVEDIKRGLGLELGERSEDGSVSLAETVCLGFCHSSPAVRDGDVVDAGPNVIERVLGGVPLTHSREHSPPRLLSKMRWSAATTPAVSALTWFWCRFSESILISKRSPRCVRGGQARARRRVRRAS